MRVRGGRKERERAGNIATIMSGPDRSMRAFGDDDRCAAKACIVMLTRSSLIGGREMIATHRVHFNCSQLPKTRARAQLVELLYLPCVCRKSQFVCSLSQPSLSHGSCEPTPFRDPRPFIQLPDGCSLFSCAVLARSLIR